MAGKAANISGMWAELRKHLDLEAPTRLVDNVYLGCSQKDIPPPQQMVADKALLFERLFGDRLKPEVRDDHQTPTTDVAGAAVCPAARQARRCSSRLSDTSTTCTERGMGSPIPIRGKLALPRHVT